MWTKLIALKRGKKSAWRIKESSHRRVRIFDRSGEAGHTHEFLYDRFFMAGTTA
jgi:hypothetical protein